MRKYIKSYPLNTIKAIIALYNKLTKSNKFIQDWAKRIFKLKNKINVLNSAIDINVLLPNKTADAS